MNFNELVDQAHESALVLENLKRVAAQETGNSIFDALKKMRAIAPHLEREYESVSFGERKIRFTRKSVRGIFLGFIIDNSPTFLGYGGTRFFPVKSDGNISCLIHATDSSCRDLASKILWQNFEDRLRIVRLIHCHFLEANENIAKKTSDVREEIKEVKKLSSIISG